MKWLFRPYVKISRQIHVFFFYFAKEFPWNFIFFVFLKVKSLLGAQNKISVVQLTNLDALPHRGAHVTIAPLKLAGGAGGPARWFLQHNLAFDKSKEFFYSKHIGFTLWWWTTRSTTLATGTAATATTTTAGRGTGAAGSTRGRPQKWNDKILFEFSFQILFGKLIWKVRRVEPATFPPSPPSERTLRGADDSDSSSSSSSSISSTPCYALLLPLLLATAIAASVEGWEFC